MTNFINDPLFWECMRIPMIAGGGLLGWCVGLLVMEAFNK